MRKPSGKRERRETAITAEFLNSRIGRGLAEAGSTSGEAEVSPAERPVTLPEPTTLTAAKALQQESTTDEEHEELPAAVEQEPAAEEAEDPENIWIIEFNGGNRTRREKIRMNTGSDR